MIKAIIFDLGGVLLDMAPLREKIYELYKPVKKNRVWHQINVQVAPLSKGEITDREFWENVNKSLRKKIPVEKLLKIWIGKYESLTAVNGGVKKLILSLKKKYVVALISNTTDEHSRVNRKRGIYDIFDGVFLSNELRLAKDGREIFIKAAKALSLKPEECVFIDDIPLYVKVARSAGMKSVLFKNAKKLEKDLTKADIQFILK